MRREKIMDGIEKILCDYYGIDVNLLNTNFSRKAGLVKIRQLFFYFASKYTNVPFVKIGKRYGLNHSTVIYSKNNIHNQIKFDKELNNEVFEIDALIKENLKELFVSKEFKKGTLFLDDIFSIKQNEGKAILFVGFNESEINNLGISGQLKRHKKVNTTILLK